MKSENISSRAIEYIENMKCNDISLNDISKEMNYSKFHFHRLFLNEIGVSVIEYLRKRRIISSTYALIATNISITDIALNNGFNSVDTYIRNFRDYFGVTPMKYRNIILVVRRDLEEESRTMIKSEYVRINNCSIEQKKNALFILDRMIELSKVAHEEGLLALENGIKMSDSIFLKKSLELLIKGTEYDVLEEILLNYITTSDLSDYEFFIRVIILEGVLLFHKGTYSWDLRIKLSSYFGEELITVIEERYFSAMKPDTIMDSETIESDNGKLIKEVKSMNNRMLQRLFRECDIIIITISLMGLKKEMREIVISSLPKGRKQILSEVFESLTGVNVKHINDANNEIIGLIQRLRMSNEI